MAFPLYGRSEEESFPNSFIKQILNGNYNPAFIGTVLTYMQVERERKREREIEIISDSNKCYQNKNGKTQNRIGVTVEQKRKTGS
jgi:hypothetical protein